MLKFPSLLVGNADSAQQKVAGDAALRKLLNSAYVLFVAREKDLSFLYRFPGD
jgi:hypothetical protein